MKTMRAVQVSRPGGPLELVERPIPDSGPGTVRIRVQVCGICHSDAMTKEGLWPGITFPRVPGHEVVGVIDAVGKGVPERWKPGHRVGVGWHAWHCLSCDNCRRNDFFACQAGVQVTGVSFDGGYADYLVAPATALARRAIAPRWVIWDDLEPGGSGRATWSAPEPCRPTGSALSCPRIDRPASATTSSG